MTREGFRDLDRGAWTNKHVTAEAQQTALENLAGADTDTAQPHRRIPHHFQTMKITCCAPPTSAVVCERTGAAHELVRVE
jgi:hypothetical protein